MSKKNLKYNELLERIKIKQAKAAQGDDVNDIKDPTDQGTTSIPKDPNGDPSKQNTPDSLPNKDKGGDPDQLEASLNPGETGTSVPSAKDGNKEDRKATEGGIEGIKSAHLNQAASGLLDKIRTTLNKSASSGKGKPPAASEKKADEKDKTPEGIASEFQFTDDFHIKLASEILKTEEGRRYADGVLRKSLGAEVASNIVKQAFEVEQAYQEELNYRHSAEYQAQMLFKQASVEDKEVIIKLAKAHSANRNKYETDIEKIAYDQGAMEAAMLMDAESEGMIPEEGGDVSIEEIIAVIDQLVAEGAIDPAMAEELLQVLAAEELGAAGGLDPLAEEAALLEEVPELDKVASVIESFES